MVLFSSLFLLSVDVVGSYDTAVFILIPKVLLVLVVGVVVVIGSWSCCCCCCCYCLVVDCFCVAITHRIS